MNLSALVGGLEDPSSFHTQFVTDSVVTPGELGAFNSEMRLIPGHFRSCQMVGGLTSVMSRPKSFELLRAGIGLTLSVPIRGVDGCCPLMSSSFAGIGPPVSALRGTEA